MLCRQFLPPMVTSGLGWLMAIPKFFPLTVICVPPVVGPLPGVTMFTYGASYENLAEGADVDLTTCVPSIIVRVNSWPVPNPGGTSHRALVGD
jgi:hypothetical protein